MILQGKINFIKIISLYCVLYVLYVLIHVVAKPLRFVRLFSKLN